MVLPEAIEKRLRRTLLEQRQQNKLRHHNLGAKRKLLFIGPPGTGKTMTAAALAGELHFSLFTILLEGVTDPRRPMYQPKPIAIPQEFP